MAEHALFTTIKTIIKLIFEAEETQLKKREDSLLARHIATGGSKDGFRHAGVIVSHLTGSARSRGQFGPLHASLVPEMYAIKTDRQMMAAEQERVRQALFLVLRGVYTSQDIRDALPNCVQDIIPGCAGLQRTRPEAYTLADNPRSLSQYMMIRDKIEFYAAARLLY